MLAGSQHLTAGPPRHVGRAACVCKPSVPLCRLKITVPWEDPTWHSVCSPQAEHPYHRSFWAGCPPVLAVQRTGHPPSQVQLCMEVGTPSPVQQCGCSTQSAELEGTLGCLLGPPPLNVTPLPRICTSTSQIACPNAFMWFSHGWCSITNLYFTLEV